MTRAFSRIGQDQWAGAIVFLLGLFAIVEGQSYGMGTLEEVGPGFVPVVLGVGLSVTGGLIALVRPRSALVAPLLHDVVEPFDKRGGSCIILAVASFLLLGAYGGLVPATFACVFIAVLGDRLSSLKEAAILATVVTAAGVAVFAFMLRVPLPLFGR